MALAARIARRQVLSSSNSGFVRTVSSLSIAGIAIGVAALIILNSFMDGFTGTILRQLTAVHPPMEVRIPGGYAFGADEISTAERVLDGFEEVTEISPVLEKTVVAAGRSGDVAGVRMRGIDWAVEPLIVSGDRLKGIDDGALVGTSLAERLDVTEGDTLRLASTDASRFSSMGRLMVDTIVPVRVAAVRDLGIEEYNSSLIFIDLEAASALLGGRVLATTLSVGLRDGADPVAAAEEITSAMREFYVTGGGHYMVCDSFISGHRNLFAALGLEKLAMTIVLALIGVVALLNLLSALTMIAIEHRRDIGVLRAMGATPRMVVLTGLLQGGMIGVGGAAAGSLFAVVLITLVNRYFPIRLESSVYWIDTLPGRLQPGLIGGIAAATVIACFAASLVPAVNAVRISPSEAVRYE